MATAEELAKKAEEKAQTPKPDPFEQDARREIKKYKKETEKQKQARQRKNREESPDTQQNNGHSLKNFVPWFDQENQKGLSWRSNNQKKIRNFIARGASYEWVLWKMKHDLGIVTSTARKIIDDALEEEPEQEPRGKPRKNG